MICVTNKNQRLMKKIKILALLAVVAFVMQDMSGIFRGFHDGWKEAGEQTEFVSNMHLSVRPTAMLTPDSLQSVVTGGKAPFWASQIESDADVKPSAGMVVCLVGAIPIGLLMFYGIYCLIRLVIAVMRGSVFTRANVRRMRFFAYSLLAGCAWLEMYRWFSYLAATGCVNIPGYEVAYNGLKYSWLSYILLAMFTEIFAVGVKIKEEQDLTI